MERNDASSDGSEFEFRVHFCNLARANLLSPSLILWKNYNTEGNAFKYDSVTYSGVIFKSLKHE